MTQTWHRHRRYAAALIRCMDLRDQDAAEALVTRLWYEDRVLFGEVLDWVWRIEYARVYAPPRRCGRPPVQPCGTEAAYDRHLYNREVACDACLGAERARKARQRRGVAADAA